MGASGRCDAIDWVKAAAILTVVWIHAYLTLARPDVGVVRFSSSLARFAVPAFLFASGFLAYQPQRLDGQWLVRRLARLLVPYLVASGIALVGLSLAVAPVGWARAGWDLLTADAVGIYYFMVPLVAAVFLALLLSRLPRHLPPLLIALAVCAWLSEAFVIPIAGATPDTVMFWHRRNPLHWLAYFALGWWVAAHVARLDAWHSSSRRAAGVILLVAAVVASAAIAWTPGSPLGLASLTSLAIYGVTLGAFLFAWDLPAAPPIRWLSDASYPIYLYHLFVISALRFYGRSLLLGRGWSMLAFDTLSYATGLAGACIVVWLGRRLFGRYSRLVLG